MKKSKNLTSKKKTKVQSENLNYESPKLDVIKHSSISNVSACTAVQHLQGQCTCVAR